MSAAPASLRTAHSFYEASARQRVVGLLDPGTFHEILGPRERITSPHLPQLDAPCAFDDGVVIGTGRLDGEEVMIAAQEGSYMGGAVGEVHGAKLVGLLRRAIAKPPKAVLLLIDSGGVRLHEANAGLIAISEIMRAVLDEIQDGSFAREWTAEHAAGLPNYKAFRQKDLDHPIEKVGAALRARMPWLNPTTAVAAPAAPALKKAG